LLRTPTSKQGKYRLGAWSFDSEKIKAVVELGLLGYIRLTTLTEYGVRNHVERLI